MLKLVAGVRCRLYSSTTKMKLFTCKTVSYSKSCHISIDLKFSILFRKGHDIFVQTRETEIDFVYYSDGS